MAKTLSQRIAARQIKAGQSAGALNRAAVLALRPEIEAALSDGWPIKTVWETLQGEGKIKCGYQAFRRHVSRLQPIPRSPLQPKDCGHARQASAMPQGLAGGFTFNAVPNKEELL